MPDKKIPQQRKQNLQVLLTVFIVVGVLGVLSRLPGVSPAEARNLATRFRFTWEKLPPVPI